MGGIVRGCGRGGPACAAVEDVFDALVGGEFAGLGGPGGGEGAPVDVVEFGVVAGFGEVGEVCRYHLSISKPPFKNQTKNIMTERDFGMEKTYGQLHLLQHHPAPPP